MIKRIEINNLIGKDYIFNINGRKITYLFGENGIGKTSVLDALYNAISSTKINSFAPFNLIIFTLDSDRTTTIYGNKFKDVVDLTFKNIVDLREKYQNSIDPNNCIDDARLGFNMKENEKIFKEIFKKFLEYISAKELSNENIKKILYKKQMDNNYIRDLHVEETLLNLLTIKTNDYNLKNKLDMDFKSNFELWDVIYLTIERLAPELSDNLKKYHDVFVNQQKYDLVEKIEKINIDINSKVKSFNENIIKCYMKIAKAIIERKDLEELSNEEKEKISSVDFLRAFSSILEYCDINIENEISSNYILEDKYLSLIAKSFLEKGLLQIFKKIDKFLITINTFLKTNNKRISWMEDSFSCKIVDKTGSYNFTDYKFSNGERQILILLFNIFFHNKENLLIIADEIESSLSPEWQEELYKVINETENVQLIGVTHSPFVCPQDEFDRCIMSFKNEIVENE